MIGWAKYEFLNVYQKSYFDIIDIDDHPSIDQAASHMIPNCNLLRAFLIK